MTETIYPWNKIVGFLRPTPGSSRILIAVLVLAAFASVQSIAAMDIHDHHGGGSHARCCLGCHAGYLPAIQPDGDMQVAPPAAAEWRAATLESPVGERHPISPDSSRAPPL